MTNNTLPLTSIDILQNILNSLKSEIMTIDHAAEIAEALDLTPCQGNWFWEKSPSGEYFTASRTLTSFLGDKLYVECLLKDSDEILKWRIEF